MKTFVIFVVILFTAFYPLRHGNASTYIDVEDTTIYAILSQLEAEGVITDALLSSRPLSRSEVARLLHEAEQNSQSRSEFIRGLVGELKDKLGPEEARLKPLDSAYARYIRTNADVLTLTYARAMEREQAFNANNNGDFYGRGSSYRAGITSRADDVGPLSVYLNPEYRAWDNTEKGVLNKGYVVLGSSWIDMIVGRDSQWWGPGYNGAILLSNNAAPLDMVKLTAPGPLTLPWIFKYLGPFQYTLFAARLDEERPDFSYPYLDGLHLNFKPLPWLEIGLERQTLLGGSGRPLSAGQWLRSFIGTRGHPSTTSSDYVDTEAGGYLKLTVPSAVQPFQVYWERDGEDSRMRRFGFPYKYADLYGIYLPRLFMIENIGLRAEYATNHVSGWPNAWYTHGNYTAGMTYNDVILGHRMGTDSNDLFFELSCRIPDARTRLLLSYDQETHDLSGTEGEETEEVKLVAEFRTSRHLEFSLAGGIGRIENPGNLPDAAQDVHEAASTMLYRF